MLMSEHHGARFFIVNAMLYHKADRTQTCGRSYIQTIMSTTSCTVTGRGFAVLEFLHKESACRRYQFPGEPDPLFTKHVAVGPDAALGATAYHSFALPPDEDVAVHLAELCFTVRAHSTTACL